MTNTGGFIFIKMLKQRFIKKLKQYVVIRDNRLWLCLVGPRTDYR